MANDGDFFLLPGMVPGLVTCEVNLEKPQAMVSRNSPSNLKKSLRFIVLTHSLMETRGSLQKICKAPEIACRRAATWSAESEAAQAAAER